MKLLNITPAQREAIKFISEFGYISTINPFPIKRNTLTALYKKGIVDVKNNKIDLVLTNRGKNIALGL